MTRTTVAVDEWTGRQHRGLMLWSDVLITQHVPDLADYGALGDRTRRVLEALAGRPRLGVMERVSITFVAGSEQWTDVYTAEQTTSVRDTGRILCPS